MRKDVVSWAIRIITGNSGSSTCRGWCLRACRRRSSSRCLSTGSFRRVPSLSTKGSTRINSRNREQINQDNRVAVEILVCAGHRRNLEFGGQQPGDLSALTTRFEGLVGPPLRKRTCLFSRRHENRGRPPFGARSLAQIPGLMMPFAHVVSFTPDSPAVVVGLSKGISQYRISAELEGAG